MAVQPMTAAELTRKVIQKEPLFILDVRNESEFDDWRIEGENVRVINKPYFELLDGVDPVADQLPKGEDILVVCAKEGSAQFVAEQRTPYPWRDAGTTNTVGKDGNRIHYREKYWVFKQVDNDWL